MTTALAVVAAIRTKAAGASREESKTVHDAEDSVTSVTSMAPRRRSFVVGSIILGDPEECGLDRFTLRGLRWHLMLVQCVGKDTKPPAFG